MNMLEEMQREVASRFKKEQGKRIAEAMIDEYEELCRDFEGKYDPMEKHKRNNIYPALTAFHAMIAEGFDRKKAAAVTDDCFLLLMEKQADRFQEMMKVPGAYKMLPSIWKRLMPRLFKEKEGFVYEFAPTDGKSVRFDMKVCPYFNTCKELDCIELAPTFCRGDEMCYGHMSPKLGWKRTKTLAEDGEPCDFEVYIKEDKEKQPEEK